MTAAAVNKPAHWTAYAATGQRRRHIRGTVIAATGTTATGPSRWPKMATDGKPAAATSAASYSAGSSSCTRQQEPDRLPATLSGEHTSRRATSRRTSLIVRPLMVGFIGDLPRPEHGVGPV